MLRTRRISIRPPSEDTPVRRLVRAIARRLTLFGNLAFLLGSMFFLSDASQTPGVWLFIFGSVAYLLDGLRRTPDQP